MHKWDAFYIDGGWVAPTSEERIEVISPHDGTPVGSVPHAQAADIDAAVQAARRAFDHGPWPQLSPTERIAAISRLASLYETKVTEFCALITAEMGAPKWFSDLGQGPGALGMIKLNLMHASDYPWETERNISLIRHEPVGVVGIVTPWNVPQIAILAKLIPAVLAGCCVVVKPSPEAPLDAMVLAELIEQAELPPGVVNILPGAGEAGRALVEHPGVDKIAFTGSTAVGRWIAQACGAQLKRCSLELGGKSAAIICEDAEFRTVTSGLRFASFMNNSEACVAQTRLLVPRSRQQELTDAIADMVAKLTVGDPSDAGSYIGPMVSQRQRDRVHSYIELGLAEGAHAAVGGTGYPEGLEGGAYVRPTLFTGVRNDMRIAQEEIFGPVVSIITYDDEEEAVRIANDSEYGLAGSVWTTDMERAASIARRVRTGTFGINSYASDVMAPFGGFKSSGIGREYGPEGLSEYVELKSIYGLKL